MINYKILQQKPPILESLTGINLCEFDKLHSEVISGWIKGEQNRLARLNRQRAIGGGRKYAHGLQNQLAMTLIWLHLSLSTDALGYFFGVHKSTVSRNTRRIHAILMELDTIKWGQPPKRKHGKSVEQALHDYPALRILADEAGKGNQSAEQVGQSLMPGQGIAQTPPFQNLSPFELDMVTQAARLCQVEQNACFYLQGDPATSFYILIEGQVRLSEVTSEGHQVLVRFANPGEAIGIIAVLKNSVYPLAAQAVQDCKALAWDSSTLENLMESIPRIAINGLRLVSQRWHEVEERYRELATERVERRVAQTLLRLVRQMGRKVKGGVLIDLSLTRQDLAEMTGTTQYTVSRILSRWEQDKLIKTSRGRILICYPHGLTLIADDLPSSPSS